MADGRGGARLGAGRPAGVPNQVALTVKETVWNAFLELQKDPEANLLAWGKKNPRDFYVIAAKLIPTELAVKAEITEIEISKTLITQAASVIETKQLDPGAETLTPDTPTGED